MLVSRRLRQSCQPFFKCRGFAKKNDSDDLDGEAEPEQQKFKKKKPSRNQKPEEGTEMGNMNPKQKIDAMQTFYDASERALKFKPVFTEEQKAEHFRIGKEYNIQSFKRHNREQKDYATKMWIQSEAMASLRPDLLEQASIIDDTPPPKDRPWPMFLTPPIKGFRLKDYVKKSEDTSEDVEF